MNMERYTTEKKLKDKLYNSNMSIMWSVISSVVYALFFVLLCIASNYLTTQHDMKDFMNIILFIVLLLLEFGCFLTFTWITTIIVKEIKDNINIKKEIRLLNSLLTYAQDENSTDNYVDTKLYKGKSALTLENVYGELYVDYDIQKFEPTDRYYIREYYIEPINDGSSYQIKYNDVRATDIEELMPEDED